MATEGMKESEEESAMEEGKEKEGKGRRELMSIREGAVSC